MLNILDFIKFLLQAKNINQYHYMYCLHPYKLNNIIFIFLRTKYVSQYQ